MANPASVINEIITSDGRDTTDGDLTARRVRLAVILNHLNSYIHNFREWEWTYAETPFTLDSGANFAYIVDTVTDPGPPPVIAPGAIPDFLEFGRQGHLYRGTVPMVETSRLRLARARQGNGSAGSGSFGDRLFSIFGGAFQFPYEASSDLDFTAFHRIRAEAITDPDDVTELRLPDRYTQTVLIPAMLWRSQEGKQDMRETWASQFTEGLSQMCAIENPIKTRMRYLPLAMHGVW